MMQANTIHPTIGDPAPNVTVTTIEGDTQQLEPLWLGSEKGIALVFLRHYGCPFCRNHARKIDRARQAFADAGLSVALIGSGTLHEAREFNRAVQLAVPLYNDPERIAYAAYGLGHASLASVLHPSVIGSGILSTIRGNVPHRSTGDPMQLQGQFIVDFQGIVRFQDRPTRMNQTASPQEMLDAIGAVVEAA